MTRIRKPNRRHVRALEDAASGEICLASSKVIYDDRRIAEAAAIELARRNPGHEIEAYYCRNGRHWHIGHAPP